MPGDPLEKTVPARVVEAYDQMMRHRVGPAPRQLGFTGTARTFNYGRSGRSGTVRWLKDGRHARAQLLAFTARVDYSCGGARIGELMPVPAHDSWWQITGGQPYEPVAESVITAVRRYALPAIQAGLDEPERPPDDGRWLGVRYEPDGGGAAVASSFTRPAGTKHDDIFASFTSDVPRQRVQAAEIVTLRAAGDPRTPAALVDRLRNDPDPYVRQLIASRMLSLMTHRPEVVSALQTAAAGDPDAGVRWAARYALRLSGDNSQA